MTVDLRSVILVTSLILLLLAIVMGCLRLSYPRWIRGLGWWAAAPLVAFLSGALFAARGVVPDLLSIVAANLLLLLGMALFEVGTRAFFGLPRALGPRLVLLGALLPFLAWFALAEPNFNARTQLVALTWAYLQLSQARLIWRQGPEVFSTRFTVVTLVLHAGVLVLRFFSALLPLPDEGLLDPSRIQTLYIVVNALIIMALMVGLILMASDRLRLAYEHAATHDSLTHALVRRALLEACEHELERCRRHPREMALLMLDIDHFKQINDQYGHQMGDRVLVDFTRRLALVLRRLDLLGRFGGEELVILLPETGRTAALQVAERICSAVAEPQAGLPPITVSIGVTCRQPGDTDVDALLGRADQALYRAKAEGRNRIALA